MKEVKAYEILRDVDGVLQPIDILQDTKEGLILVFLKLKKKFVLLIIWISRNITE